MHGLKNYCTSVALSRRGQIVVAAIYDPEADECFTAVRSAGALLNGRPLTVSNVGELGQALVASGFSPQVRSDSVEARIFLELLERCQSVRRLGSAALNLCYVAAGRLDAYWALNVKAWDVAAGWLLVEEAGGKVTAPEGGAVDLQKPRLVSSATESLHLELLSVLATTLGGESTEDDA